MMRPSRTAWTPHCLDATIRNESNSVDALTVESHTSASNPIHELGWGRPFFMDCEVCSGR